MSTYLLPFVLAQASELLMLRREAEFSKVVSPQRSYAGVKPAQSSRGDP
jgi:hypothetical protein